MFIFDKIDYLRRLELKYATLELRKNFFANGNEENIEDYEIMLSNICLPKFKTDKHFVNTVRSLPIQYIIREVSHDMKKALNTTLTEEEEMYVALHVIFGSDQNFHSKYKNVGRNNEAMAKLYSVTSNLVKARYNIFLQNNKEKKEQEEYLDKLTEQVTLKLKNEHKKIK